MDKNEAFRRSGFIVQDFRVKAVSGLHLDWLRDLSYVKWDEEGYKAVPDEAGIYFIADQDFDLLYIGKSRRLRQRAHTVHNQYPQVLRACNGDRRYFCWMVCPYDEGLLTTIESALIYQYQPPLNTIHKQINPRNEAHRMDREEASLREKTLDDLYTKRSRMISNHKDKPCPACTAPRSSTLVIRANKTFTVTCKSCGYATDRYSDEALAYKDWGSGLKADK